jgi:hypothetical protein
MELGVSMCEGPGGSTIQSLHGFRTAQNCFEFVLSFETICRWYMFAFSYFAVGVGFANGNISMHVTILIDCMTHEFQNAIQD